MNANDKPKFMELLSILFGAHCKPLTESVTQGYWKGLNKMELGTFERAVDEAIDRLQHAERGVSKVPNVSELWDIKRSLRRFPMLADRHSEPEFKGDCWDSAANTFLLNYVTAGVVQSAIHGQRPSRDASRYASPECTAILVKWKTGWATDMREDRAHYGGKRDGKAYWAECMRSAEAEIDALSRKAAA